MQISHKITRHTDNNLLTPSVNRGVRSQTRSQFVIALSGFLALIFASYSPPIVAGSQCWVGQFLDRIGVYSPGPLGPYPDRDAILAAAKSKMDELLLGKPYNDYCYPDRFPSLPIIATELTCSSNICDDELCDYRTGICTPLWTNRYIWAISETRSCYVGNFYAYNYALGAKPLPACAGSYTIRLSPGSDASESASILASIEPDRAANLVAKVYDQNNQLVPNVGVRLALEAKQDSGGHHHGDDTAIARTGTLAGQQILTGNTGTDGLQINYKAPRVSGDYKIVASCTDGKNCKVEGPDTVWVGVKDLVPLPGSDVYVLIPNVNDPKHPENHYMTSTAMLRVTALATLYHGQFPDDPLLHLNDASLERGGIFDFKYEGRSIWWTPPHFEHCRGTEIDIRANLSDGAIPESNFPEFDRIAKRVGADPVRECKADENKQCIISTRHYHVRLAGGKPQCP